MEVQWSKGPTSGLPFVADFLAVGGKFSKQCQTEGLLAKEPNYWDSDGIDFSDTEVMLQLRTTLFEWAEVASTLVLFFEIPLGTFARSRARSKRTRMRSRVHPEGQNHEAPGIWYDNQVA